VALTIGFYALAIGLIAVLVRIMFIPDVPGRVLIFCLVGAGAIAVSIIPRPTRFTPPGPRLNPAGQVRLFAELEGVARAVGEAMPEEVYISPEMNAGVFQRGRRRVMVVGLPLMQVMTIPQMRVVLAHKFGHYHGNDTKLGPLIYRMRETIERTLRTLSGQAALLGLLFLAYGRMFMRVTQAVSRRQELAADELAARTVGSGPMIEGLRALGRGSLAFDVYWRSEVVPLLEAGFQPPLADGFARFLAEPEVMKEIGEAAEQELAKPRSDAYDSHPPDAERITALLALPPGPGGEDPNAAVTLLEGLEAIEPWILVGVIKPGVQLRPVSWAESGNAALVPGWRERVRRQAHMIGSYTVGWLPELVKYADRIGQAEAAAARQSVPADRARMLGVSFAGAAFANALAQNGWTAESLPGRPPVMRRGEAAIEPFSEINKIARGEVDADTWQRRCWDLGIRDLSLMPA